MANKSSKQILIVFAAVILFAAIVLLSLRFAKIPGLSQTQIVSAEKGMLTQELSEDIVLSPVTNIDLSFENSGKIKNVLVKVGDDVKKGQLLAEQINSDYVVALSAASNQRDAAEAQVEEDDENVDVQKAKVHSLQNANAKKYDIKSQKEQVNQAEAGVDVSEALLRAAEDAVRSASLQLAKTKLLAPMNGVITDKFIEPGEVVASASPVMKFSSADILEADAFVSELDVKKIKVGDEVDIALSSIEDDANIKGRVKTIYPAESPQNGISSYKVVIELIEQKSSLKSGLTGTAHIKLSEQSGAVMVPESSVFSDGGKKYVMTISNGLPARKEVQTGTPASNRMIEIISGLAEGDQIIKF